ncbi:hypothetical protein Pfo_013401 [Paulownia fortunei]|nr:hypothetical protein Pfo_013401 [Paulownia fortunei]
MDIGDQKIGFENKDQMNKYSNNMKRVCHICHKAFSSGKALGGHMRIHVQRANKKDLVFKKKLNVHQTITFKKQNPREEAEEKVIDFVKKKHRYKKTTTATNLYGGSDNKIKKPTCIICGKDFRSMKSLFGHMRCHPERDWRGIHPPSSMAKNSSSSSLSDADPPKIDDQMELLASGEKNREVDLAESLRGWPVTARRGRKAMAAASSSELSSSEDDQLRDAVNYLMMLARGASLESGVTQRQKLGESEAANSFCKPKILGINRVPKSKKLMIDQSTMGITTHSPVEQLGNEQRGSNEVGKAVIAGSGLVNGESVNKSECQEWLEEHEHNYVSDDDQMDSKSTGQLNDRDFESTNFKVLIKNKKKRKKVKLCDLELAKNASPVIPVHQKVVEVTSITPDKYRCNTCDKSFPTYQALGGHRSSHNKFNIIIHNSMGDNDNLSNPTAQEEETKEHDKRGISSNLVEGTQQHQCMICNKIFSTAQALGVIRGAMVVA